MTEDPWYRKTTRDRNLTVVLQGIAIVLFVLYVSLLVGARFA